MPRYISLLRKVFDDGTMIDSNGVETLAAYFMTIRKVVQLLYRRRQHVHVQVLVGLSCLFLFLARWCRS